MECKMPVNVVNLPRQGSHGPRPAPPPKPKITPGASTRFKGSPPALPRNSPVARVKPMKHDSLDSPNAQLSSSPGKTPPPLPCTPPKGSPTKLSPKLPAKFPSKPPALGVGKPTDGETSPAAAKADSECPPSHEAAQTPSDVTTLCQKGSPSSARNSPKRSPLPEVKVIRSDLEGSAVSETADVEKAHIKPPKAAPAPPMRPRAPTAKGVPKPAPRKRSLTSWSSIDQGTPEPEDTVSPASPRSPLRPPVPKQRSFENKPPSPLPVARLMQKSASVDEEPNLKSAGSPTSARPAEPKVDFSSKLAGLLVQGPKKIGSKHGIDSGDEVMVEAGMNESSGCEIEQKGVVDREVKTEIINDNQTHTQALKIPPRKKKNKKSRESSPAGPDRQLVAESKDHSPEIIDKTKEISPEVDQNANDIHSELEHSSSPKPTAKSVEQTSSVKSDKIEDTNVQSPVQVNKRAKELASLVAKGLQHQLTMKSRPSISPKPMSRSNSSDGGLTPSENEEDRLLSPTQTPPHLPEIGSVGSREKPRSPQPVIKQPLLPPRLPPKFEEGEKKDTRSGMAMVEKSEGDDSRRGSGHSVTSQTSDEAENEPPPPVPVRTAPKMKRDNSIDIVVTPSSPDVASSHGNQGKKREKRPLPPLPTPEEEIVASCSSVKAQGPRLQNRPLPPVPGKEEVPRPARKAPGPPLGRKRSKSTPGPIPLHLEEFRPRSQDVDEKKKWTDEDEKTFLELKQVSEKLKRVGFVDVHKVERPVTRQSSREGRPVFKAPPPPPIDGASTADRGSQTPVEDVIKFDFEGLSDVILEEDEATAGEVTRVSRVGEGAAATIVSPTSPVSKEVRRPFRVAPPPPPPRPKLLDETTEEGHCDELGYLSPKQQDSQSANLEEYSYVSSEYYPEEEGEKQRSDSSLSSQHIYEFVDTSRKEIIESVSDVPVDDTYEVPGEVMMRQHSSTSSHTYQKMDPPQAPPRPKRQTLRQKSMDILSLVVPVDTEIPARDVNADNEYIYPGAPKPTLESQNIQCESTYDISNIRLSRDSAETQRQMEDDLDGADDYILPGRPLIESESTYDISSTPINSPVKLDLQRNDSRNLNDLQPKHNSLTSSTSSDNHDYFDMTGVPRRHSFTEHSLSLGSLQLQSLTASQEELWHGGQSDYSDTASEEETGDDEDENKPKKPKVFYIAREIMTSEEVFVDVLKLLNLDFRQAVSSTTEEVGRPIIPSVVLNRILHYLPQLESFNSEFLQDLHKRVDNWEDDPRIADIFVCKGPFLRLYIGYIKGFDEMISMFDDACKKYPIFNELVKDFEGNERCANLALRHYMLKPIQRIPQYKLLLQDYLNHLSEHSIDYKDASAALAIVSEIATHANESMREGDNFQKLLEVQNSLHGNFEVVKPGRTLIKMGILQKLSRKEAQPRMLFLFNDVLLYTTPIVTGKEYKLNHVLSLAGMKACKPTQEEFQNEFSVISIQRSFTISAKMDFPHYLVFDCSTPRERDAWLAALTQAIEDNAEKRSTFEQAKTHPEKLVMVDKDFQLGLQAPVWVPDARVTMCMLCTSEFTVTWRRHHCRACGRVICGACSDYKAPLIYLKSKSVRVCRECFEKIEPVAAAEDGRLTPTAEGEEKRPRNTSESFKKSKKWVNRLHIKRPSVLKEVQANDTGSVMSGYMKVIRGKKWKKRWFVIKDKVLYTYKASEDAAASRSTPLLGYEIKTFTEYFENAEPSLVFQVSHKGTDPVVFRTESASTKDKWIQAIKDATVA
ncbi:titin-like isoform X2 [Lineus longissimus]|uniref:titin-like isoform X2 n=1 Tax=Lineus longissimus TaxID=88925 RepID=UPI00315C6A13